MHGRDGTINALVEDMSQTPGSRPASSLDIEFCQCLVDGKTVVLNFLRCLPEDRRGCGREQKSCLHLHPGVWLGPAFG